MLDAIAARVLSRYQQLTGDALVPPIGSEQLLDVVFGDELSSPLWDELAEQPGRAILAGLAPAERVIVLNARRRELIKGTPGLQNDTLAHELAHWLLHVERDLLGHPALPGASPVLTFQCDAADESYQAGHRSWDERNAHMLMSRLLLPADLLSARARDADLRSWPGLYRLRDEFDVSITAMRIRLEELRFTHVDQRGVFHASRQEASGQQRLF